MATLIPLPIYPSSHARKGFSASQLAQFHQNISNAVAQVIALPPAKRDTPATRAFVSSYASDAAHQVLQALIWEDADATKGDDRLPQRVLLLAEKLASSAPGLELRTILDLCVAFSPKASRLKAICTAALGGTPDLASRFASEVVPAFTALLNSSDSRSSGLYRLCKIARCITSLLRPSPPELIRPFAHDKNFILALARAYEDSLDTISRSYGGIRIDVPNRQPDHWEQLWLVTKVDLVDAFHIIMTTMVKDISTASETQLAAEADRACGIVSALLAVAPQPGRVQSANSGSAVVIPFLNRSLVADYQHAYDLNRMLASALRHAGREDAPVDAFESTLRSLDLESSRGNSAKDPGALKLLLRSSGIAPGRSNELRPAGPPALIDKGKARATTPEPTPAHDPDLDLKISQVLDIFPNQSPEYIRGLLLHPSFPFRGNTEKVVEALLEGTAPGEDALGDGFEGEFSAGVGDGHAPAIDVPTVRLNVFDDEIIDLDRVHIGKKIQDETTLIRDGAEVEQMKANVLRLAEAMWEVSDDDEVSGKGKALEAIDLDDDFEGAGGNNVRVIGDGEDSGDEEDSEERGIDPTKPETILESAYIRDPNLFDRDAQTRRSKARTDLKAQTGWSDEQIEGWRIMLERNPKKDRVLQKHEFSGNKIEEVPILGSSSSQPAGGQRGRGRGRGSGGRGKGKGGRGGSGSGGSGDNANAVVRDRAFKDKHKASAGNHNRKRGHDKKMARAGAAPSA
ncbi:hypothetical protein PAXRUDRAFT_130135 [Paxillus rubicundulus Ve08.2h10]|uniref:CUE domain-containing protein n=1 Tax=Paxillus rubicundulus Ve08.2h10 TaxID=930991 RepID=A0A0D0DN62_9AGAM|nr:hypothetical protein PAXRUDRAFT_130135 [Paxillus rubicundulus Ve08.2h10]